MNQEDLQPSHLQHLKTRNLPPEKPSAPTNVKVSEITHTTAIVTWEPAAERAMAPGYNVYLDNKKQNELPIEGTEYKLTGLKVGTRYNVAVTVVDVDGIESDRTEEVEDTFITKADKEKLQETTKDADKALENKDKYTEESLKNLEEVYKKYQEVLNGDNVTQEEVEEANKAIEEAFKNLVAKDDGKKDPPTYPRTGSPNTDYNARPDYNPNPNYNTNYNTNYNPNPEHHTAARRKTCSNFRKYQHRKHKCRWNNHRQHIYSQSCKNR